MASLAKAQGDTFRAAKLFGAAEALREVTGCKLSEAEKEEYDSELETLRNQMGEAVFTSGRAEGKCLGLEEAVSFALE